MGEGTEPWETVEVGVDVVMFHLGAARTIAQLGGIYRSNAESKLQGNVVDCHKVIPTLSSKISSFIQDSRENIF